LPDYCYAPIAIFAFNRPDLAGVLVTSLEQTEEWRKSKVFVFIDGPRNESERAKTEATRTYFESLDHPFLTVMARQENIGLKSSLSSGISTVCASHENVIVIEDDLELSPDALLFFNSALYLYRNDRRVWSICGDIPELDGFKRNSACFMPVGSSWGWATWSDRWAYFSETCDLTSAARCSRVFLDRINVHGLRRFDRMLAMEEAGLISSWYVHWQLTITRAGGLSLFPPVPMVRNRGFGDGTHSSAFNLPKLFGVERKSLGYMTFSLPDEVEIDFEFTQQVIESPEWRLLRLNSRLGQWWRKLKRLLGV
jgi:hypothetical protein